MSMSHISDSFLLFMFFYVVFMTFMMCGGAKLLANKPPQRPTPRRQTEWEKHFRKP